MVKFFARPIILVPGYLSKIFGETDGYFGGKLNDLAYFRIVIAHLIVPMIFA